MPTDSERLVEYHNKGWMTATHNDYTLNGEWFTFWLLTKRAVTHRAQAENYGIYVKGEGRTDSDAFDMIDAAMKAEAKSEGD